jgi:hypothetical protein
LGSSSLVLLQTLPLSYIQRTVRSRRYNQVCYSRALLTILEGEADDKRWLTYWSVQGFLTMIEYYLEYFVSFLPFYWEIKILLMIWLIHPLGAFDGSKFVYHVYIQPILASRERAIDQLLIDFGMGNNSFARN